MNDNDPKRIIRFAAHYYGRTIDELMVRGGKRAPLAQQRHVAMWLCRYDTDYSYPALAKLFGTHDHTTILKAVAKMDKLLRTGHSRAAARFRRDIIQIRELLDTGYTAPGRAELSLRRDSVSA